MVIGGKLGVSEQGNLGRLAELMAAGFDAVFDDSVAAVADFRTFVRSIPPPAAAPLEAAEAAV
jgi:methylaspartate mutase sigma subunit